MNEKIKAIIEKCTNSKMTNPWPLVDYHKLWTLLIQECINIELREINSNTSKDEADFVRFFIESEKHIEIELFKKFPQHQELLELQLIKKELYERKY